MGGLDDYRRQSFVDKAFRLRRRGLWSYHRGSQRCERRHWNGQLHFRRRLEWQSFRRGHRRIWNDDPFDQGRRKRCRLWNWKCRLRSGSESLAGHSLRFPLTSQGDTALNRLEHNALSGPCRRGRWNRSVLRDRHLHRLGFHPYFHLWHTLLLDAHHWWSHCHKAGFGLNGGQWLHLLLHPHRCHKIRRRLDRARDWQGLLNHHRWRRSYKGRYRLNGRLLNHHRWRRSSHKRRCGLDGVLYQDRLLSHHRWRRSHKRRCGLDAGLYQDRLLSHHR